MSLLSQQQNLVQAQFVGDKTLFLSLLSTNFCSLKSLFSSLCIAGYKINKVGWVLWKEVVEIEQKWFYSNTDTIQPSVNSRYCKTNMKKDNITVKGFFVLMDISIHLLLLFIFVCWFGTPIISDFTNYSTVFTEETIKFNGLPGISFVRDELQKKTRHIQ